MRRQQIRAHFYATAKHSADDIDAADKRDSERWATRDLFSRGGRYFAVDLPVAAKQREYFRCKFHQLYHSCDSSHGQRCDLRRRSEQFSWNAHEQFGHSDRIHDRTASSAGSRRHGPHMA